jgi:hypothetical protein
MKQRFIVAGHALAIGTPVVIHGTEVQFYQCRDTGGLFALDGSYLESTAEEDPFYVPSPFKHGKALQLVDSESEIRTSKITGDAPDNDPLVDSALEKIKEEVAAGDLTSIEELLSMLPEEALKNYVG